MNGKADVCLDMYTVYNSMGDWSSETITQKSVFFELRPKELSKYGNIVRCFDTMTWTFLFLSFIITIGTLKLRMTIFDQYSKEVSTGKRVLVKLLMNTGVKF